MVLFRQLQHQNLCKFFGSTIYKDHVSPENYQVILVMELYQKNLRSVVFNNDFTCPANSGEENAAVLTRFLQWALEIADALAYIHSMKLIHKHLKMENILVSMCRVCLPHFAVLNHCFLHESASVLRKRVYTLLLCMLF